MVAQTNRADTEAVLGKRHDNGADYWSTPDGRLLVGDPFSTLTSLLVLHELRVPRTHEAVRGALDLVWKAWREDGRVRIAPGGAMYPCHTALAAAIVCRFGYARDRRVQAALGYLSGTCHEDGGWRCNMVPVGRAPETDCSNPGVTLFVLDAFRFTDLCNTDPSLERAVDSLLEHWVVRRPLGPCEFGIGTQFLQVEYPMLRYNLFYYVYVLSFYERARRDGRFQAALGILESKLDGRGRVIVERPNRKLGQLLACCAKGVASAPATRRYREMVKNVEG